MLAAAIVSEDRNAALRKEIAQFMVDEGRDASERCLALLLRLSPRVEPRVMTKFPFGENAARASQKLCADELGVPVVPIVANLGQGVPELREFIVKHARNIASAAKPNSKLFCMFVSLNLNYLIILKLFM